MTDLQAHKLEIAIELAGKAMLAAPTTEAQRVCQTAMLELIKQRSALKVKQMEKRRGLA